MLDNIDQKDENVQVTLFQSAQEILHTTHAFVIVSLRESTYLHLRNSPKLDAFSAIDFHVRVQPGAIVIDRRLQYCCDRLGDDSERIESVSGISLTVQQVRAFIRVLQNTVLSEHAGGEVIRCIEAVSNAHTRGQLQMVNSKRFLIF